MDFGNILHNNNSEKVLQWFDLITKDSEDVLIITGYSSLEFLINNFKKIENKKIKLLLGSEFVDFKNERMDLAIYEFWFKKGFNLNIIKKIKHFYDFVLDSDLFEIKIDDENVQHSKIYLTEDYAILGSSNYTYGGFSSNKETNILLDSSLDSENYENLKKLSLSYWKDGVDYKKNLIEILKSLLDFVNFDDALSLIIQEHLDGRRSSVFEDAYSKLWEHQKVAVGRTQESLLNRSSIILALPTGSGKTKIATKSILPLIDKYHNQRDTVLVIAPPSVEKEWNNEFKENHIYKDSYNFISTGVIPRLFDSKKNEDKEVIKNKEYLKESKIIIIDEAHRFKNINSSSFMNAIKNQADYIILLTATPINRGLDDLRGFVYLLDPNNIDYDAIDFLSDIFKSNKNYTKDLNEKQKNDLRNHINKFTIRFTIDDINKISELYSKEENPKQYPKINPKTYFYDEEFERNKFSKYLNQIKGLYFFFNETPKGNFSKLFRKIKPLTQFHFKYNFRSSPAALHEHIYGTESSLNKYLSNKYTKNNNIGVINTIKNKKPLTKDYTNSKHIEQLKMEWIFKKELFNNEINNETKIYNNLYENFLEYSKSIFENKINKIIELSKKHNKIIIFDKIPISVFHLHFELSERLKESGITIKYITSENKNKDIENIKDLLGENNNSKVILITSNVLSESVNLQASNCIFFSDIPLTPVFAEQRVGRICRMNSEYDNIFIWWPKFSNELTLNNDYRLHTRNETINESIGSNLILPEYLNQNIKYNKDDVLYSDNIVDDDNNTMEADIEKNNELLVNNISKQDFIPLGDYYLEQKNILLNNYSDLNINKNNFPQNATVVNFVKSKENFNLFMFVNLENNTTHLYLKKEDEDIIIKTDEIVSFIIENIFDRHNDILHSIDNNEIIIDDNRKKAVEYIKKNLLNNKEIAIQKLLNLYISKIKSKKFYNDYNDLFGDINYSEIDTHNKYVLNEWKSIVHEYWIEEIKKSAENNTGLPTYTDIDLGFLLNDFEKSREILIRLIHISKKHKNKEQEYFLRVAVIGFKK